MVEVEVAVLGAVDLVLDGVTDFLRLRLPQKPDGFSMWLDEELLVEVEYRSLCSLSFLGAPLSRPFRALLSPISSRLWSVQMTSNMAAVASRNLLPGNLVGPNC